ncbi:SUZ RNA-binding domain-containing-like [Salminus brasiliensis]|uniref:SUZ RNA-binding domain-containing-like n=1 Tax=Salminus brasiliensis TaxID=930266 RepID=UPI003B8324AE
MEDEDVSDNWEDAADSGEIERRLEAKLKISQKSNNQSLPVKTAVVIQDDSLPAAPPPQIRILKRPASNGSLGQQVASRPAQQVKSLAQREAEYAEARRRILGSAEEPSQERPDADRPALSGAPSESLRPNNHIIRQPLGPDGTTGFRLSR